MDIHLSNSISSGQLSNEIPNLITGVMHLAGRAQPLRLELRGNFLKDIAGCVIDFRNAVPQANAGLIAALHVQQRGYAGEMTASRRIQRMMRKNAPPASPALAHASEGLKNLLFLEWFNEQGQRVVVQAWHWNLLVSAPRWVMPRELELAHIKAIRARRREFLLGGPGSV
ncbi:MAG: hypothetical protein ACOYMN_04570 [Roseimicrobium sp.]